MNDGRRGCLQTQVAAIAMHADVVAETFGVPAKVYLVVGLKEISGGEDHFTFVIALEAGAWSRVKDAIGTVAVICGVATALCFEVIDVSRIDLRADVAGDIGIGNRHAVDEP